MHREEGQGESDAAGAAAERLWWVGVCLAAVLCAGWSLPRVKPVVLFAVGYGLVLTVVGWWFGGALQVRWLPRMRWGLFVLAGCGVWGAVGMAAVRQEQREWERQGLARRLLAEFPRTAEDEHGGGRVETSRAWARRYAPLGGLGRYWPVLLLGEGLLAGGVAVGCLAWLARRRGTTQEREGRR